MLVSFCFHSRETGAAGKGGWWNAVGSVVETMGLCFGAVTAACQLVQGCLWPSAGWLFFEAGSRPGSRLPFLDSPRKVRSKKATRMSATLRFAAGNLRRGSCGVRRETLFALRATFKHHGESDDEAVLSFGRTATPQPPRRRRGHTGSGCGPSLRSAWSAGALAILKASIIAAAPCSGAGA